MLATNQEFAEILLKSAIPFAFEQTPGAHGVNYWSREIATSIAVQYTVLDRNVKAWIVRSAAEQLEQQAVPATDGSEAIAAPDEALEEVTPNPPRR